VLLHERGHVQQRDALGAALFNLAMPLLWFCPFYWMLRRAAVMSRELLADDYAARADGKETYASCLVSLAKRGLAPVVGSPAIGLFQRKSDLYRRIQMLLKRDRNLSYRCSKLSRCALALAWLVAVAGLAAFVGVKPAIAQDREKEKEKLESTIREQELLNRTKQYEAELLELRKLKEQAAAQRDALRDEREAAMRADYEAKIKDLHDKAARIEALRARDQKAADEAAAAAANQKGVAKAVAGEGGAVIAGVHLDVVSLANSVVDASGAKAVAEARLKRLAPLAKENNISREELETAEANYVTAKKRVDLLRGIARVALDSAKREAETTKRLVDKGFASPGTFEQHLDKMRMLELIIQSAD
jgi:hypothetical protein